MVFKLTIGSKLKKVFAFTAIIGGVALALTACSGQKQGGANNSKTDKRSVALITDTGGIDDHSFNESAWTGIKSFGKQHNLSQGKGGYQYFQSNSASDYEPNFEQAANAGYQTIIGVGYSLKDAVSAVAKKYPKKNFVIIDETINGQKNVASVNFKSNESSYLAGVAAAYTTKTNTVGFIGGTHGQIIDLFDGGFTQGVNDTAKKLHKKITILNQYVGDFTSTDKAKSIAQSMYAKKADIIYQAAGAAGNGVFQQAKDINQARPVNKKVWVIGVDMDQSAQGEYTARGGQKSNFTLTSDITGVSIATKTLSNDAFAGKFPGGKHLLLGLQDNGVALTKGQLSQKTWKQVQMIRQDVISGKIKVVTKPEN